MAEILLSNFEEGPEREAANNDELVLATRSEKRAQALAILDEFRNRNVDDNAYFSASIVPMGGSRNTIRRRKRNGGYSY